MDAGGAIAAAAKRFAEELLIVDFAPGAGRRCSRRRPSPSPPPHDRLGEIHDGARARARATTCGKNRFAKAVIGLSGGIDSALTAAIAVEALGADRVVGVSMPSRFNSRETRSDAARVAANLGIRFLEIPIQETYESYLRLLAEPFGGGDPGVAGENLQARVRGNILMALSNRFGWLVLTTGNKSETAVGYCTLYGDMAGGFAVIKDVPKTLVWELVRRPQPPRPPRGDPGEHDRARPLGRAAREPARRGLAAALPGAGRDPRRLRRGAALAARRSPRSASTPRTVERVIRLVDGAEYKRRQAPPGVKITPRAFGRDRRLPITNRWTEHWRADPES